MNEFEYKTMYYRVQSEDDMKAMAKDVAWWFNEGWKPTTNGPCLVIPMMAPASTAGQVWYLMYVYAKEVPHGHN